MCVNICAFIPYFVCNFCLEKYGISFCLDNIIPENQIIVVSAMAIYVVAELGGLVGWSTGQSPPKVDSISCFIDTVLAISANISSD